MAVDKQDKPATDGHSTAALTSGADALVLSHVPAGTGWARDVPFDTATLSVERYRPPSRGRYSSVWYRPAFSSERGGNVGRQ